MVVYHAWLMDEVVYQPGMINHHSAIGSVYCNAMIHLILTSSIAAWALQSTVIILMVNIVEYHQLDLCMFMSTCVLEYVLLLTVATHVHVHYIFFYSELSL